MGDLTSTGCTQSALQVIDAFWNGLPRLSVDRISKISGYTKAQKQAHEGMTSDQVDAFFKDRKLPYKVVVNASLEDLRTAVDTRGPIMVAVGYDFYPEWRGYHYRGEVADGHPNGYAQRNHGRTQLTGAFGHAIVVGATRDRDDIQPGLVRWWLHDPNHRSAARPEPSAIDVITGEQMAGLYHRFRKFGKGGNLVAWVPTKTWSAPK